MNEAIPPVQPPVPPAGSGENASTRSLEVLCHVSAVAGFMVPFGNIWGPLIVWLLKRDESPGVDAHGKEALNFQISWSIYGLVLTAVMVGLWLILLGWILIPVLAIGWVAMVILTVIGSIKASNGQLYRYPLTIRFLQ